MAEVYRAQYMGHAHSVGPQNEVVVKRIKPSLFKAAEFPIFREMFLNEAKLVRSLQHPNLARMHMLNEAVDKAMGVKVPFIVGEYIRGLQLWKLLRIATSAFTGRGVMPAIAAYIIRETARGLGHAHAYKDPKSGRSQPIIHRDVAPDNIMISTDGKVKVIDFGVAKAIGGFGPHTKTGIIKGKLAYMAPEQVAQKVVPATDVFGAAIILHEMLTGRRLFGGANDFVVVSRVLKAEIPPPSKFLLGIPPELEEVLMKALSRDVKKRYPDGNAFADALTEVMQRVPQLRGVNEEKVKAWSEELQVEAAFRANPEPVNVSAEHEPLEPEQPEDHVNSVSSGEIELSGEDVVFAGIADVLVVAPERQRSAASHAITLHKPLRITKKHQIATLASFCNECGNCDIFCPEDGGPYLIKPRFFGTREEWRQHARLDGFYVERRPDGDEIVGRFAGRALALLVKDDEARYSGEGFAVACRLSAPEATLAGEAAGEVDLTYLRILDGLRRAVLADTEVTFVNC